ncbi:MAG: hypothetical protein V3W18_14605 [candidate division Zixibacteria bacterium]
MRKKAIRDDPLLRFVGIFLPAGTSALLLSIAHFQHKLWFLSLFALVPYLWKLKRTSLQGSIVLGSTFALCFTFVVFIEGLFTSPALFAIKALALVLIFSIFGIAVNRVKKYIGFYPVFIAALWIPLEYFLIRFAGINGILNFQSLAPGWLIRFGSLFGLLTISFIIILINSAILLLIERARKIRYSVSRLRFPNIAFIFSLLENTGYTRKWYYLPNLRAPPHY